MPKAHHGRCVQRGHRRAARDKKDGDGPMTTPAANIVAAAREAEAKWRIPSSVSIAQFALESGWGQHAPGRDPFGMKPRSGKFDPAQLLMTTEWSKARGYYKVSQMFRTFASIADAFLAHAELIATAPVYAAAMAALPDTAAFLERMAAHYATDPLYASKITAIIAGSRLQQYDLGAKL
jgi:flagellum-specific peptidoglycan hydrolase FlgJ